MRHLMHTMTLFASMTTLICCALPALLVALGMGATLAGLVSTVPQLVWFSEHKGSVFIFAAVMLTLAGIMRYRSRNASCPADPELAEVCGRTRKWSGAIYFTSLAIFCVGLFFAYLAPYLL